MSDREKDHSSPHIHPHHISLTFGEVACLPKRCLVVRVVAFDQREEGRFTVCA